MKQGNVFTFGDIMGLRRRIKNKIKSIFFGSKDDEQKNTGVASSNVMYETTSSPIQSKDREEIEEEFEDDLKQDKNDDPEKEDKKEEVVEDIKEEETKEEETKEEVLESPATPKVIDEKTTTPEDIQEILVADTKDTAQDISDEASALQSLFNDEDIEQAVFIYNVSKLDMTHCPNCNEEVFGNWTYEEGKYLCSICQSVLA